MKSLSFFDWIVLIGLTGLVVFWLVHRIRTSLKGGCCSDSGGCAGCSGGCSRADREQARCSAPPEKKDPPD